MAHSDLVLGGHCIEAVIGIGQHRHLCKFGDEIGNRLVELHLAFADEDHRRDPRDRFGHGINALERVDIDRRLLALRDGAYGDDVGRHRAPPNRRK
jgi:hypothetical protein